eukprot:m.190493 g.190493  ORF g.190493 m.190493 type:complete len:1282 (-) comp15641_c0_seq8:2766-6611(-)
MSQLVFTHPITVTEAFAKNQIVDECVTEMLKEYFLKERNSEAVNSEPQDNISCVKPLLSKSISVLEDSISEIMSKIDELDSATGDIFDWRFHTGVGLARFYSSHESARLISSLLRIPCEHMVDKSTNNKMKEVRLKSHGVLLATLLNENNVQDPQIRRNALGRLIELVTRYQNLYDADISIFKSLFDSSADNCVSLLEMSFGLVDERFLSTCLLHPTATRNNIVYELICQENKCLTLFQNFVKQNAHKIDFLKANSLLNKFVSMISVSAISANSAWENHACPLNLAVAFNDSNQTKGCLQQLTHSIYIEIIADISKSPNTKNGGRGVLGALGNTFCALLCVAPRESLSVKERIELFKKLCSLAESRLTMTVQECKICLAILHGLASSLDELSLYEHVSRLFYIVLLVVDQNQYKQRNSTLVDEGPSAFTVYSWELIPAFCERLLKFSFEKDCSMFSRYVLSFQQQVCDLWLSFPHACDAVRRSVIDMQKIDKNIQPLQTLYREILRSPHFETSMLHDQKLWLLCERMNTLHELKTTVEFFDVTQKVTLVLEKEDSRLAIAKLILTLVQQQPDVVSPEHLKTLLLVYNASNGPADMILLSILEQYDNYLQMSADDFLLWGQESRQNNSETQSLSTISSLDCVDDDRLAYTTQNMYTEKPEVSHYTTILCNGNPQDADLLHKLTCYNPTFLLQIFKVVICNINSQQVLREMVDCGAVSYILSILSHSDSKLRELACEALARIEEQISTSNLRERRQVCVAVGALKNAIPGPEFPQIPGAITNFVGLAVRVAFHPEHVPVYPIINKFLLQRPALDTDDVPLFYNMFLSSSDTCKNERAWMLRFLSTGLKSSLDYAIFKRRRVMDLVLHLYSSPLADLKTKGLIFKILVSLSHIPSASMDMVRSHGLFPWLVTVAVVGTGGISEIQALIRITLNLICSTETEMTEVTNARELKTIKFQIWHLVASLVNRLHTEIGNNPPLQYAQMALLDLTTLIGQNFNAKNDKFCKDSEDNLGLSSHNMYLIIRMFLILFGKDSRSQFLKTFQVSHTHSTLSKEVELGTKLNIIHITPACALFEKKCELYDGRIDYSESLAIIQWLLHSAGEHFVTQANLFTKGGSTQKISFQYMLPFLLWLKQGLSSDQQFLEMLVKDSPSYMQVFSELMRMLIIGLRFLFASERVHALISNINVILAIILEAVMQHKGTNTQLLSEIQDIKSRSSAICDKTDKKDGRILIERVVKLRQAWVTVYYNLEGEIDVTRETPQRNNKKRKSSSPPSGKPKKRSTPR